MNALCNARLEFEKYCTGNFNMSPKHFRMVPWEWVGNKSTYNKTYTNNVTEGMWKLWLQLKKEKN